MAKKPVPSKSVAEKKSCSCPLPLLAAGAAGFLAAVLLLKGLPMMGGCPMYSDVCPVTSTVHQIEVAIEKNDLPMVRSKAEKLSQQLERTMPDLASLADRLAESSSINQAKSQLQVLEQKMMSDISTAPKK
ncbi:MAG: hypothetical protein EBQ51_07455 [Verrucomicrobia bacterium]|nr:hypothetical protein [Pseudomonadota bacterium]NBS06158.1 hypothetical protein [Verrucomicrobiota bacterium]NBS78674.1 hypothetical protein [bacterium]NBS49221.1 hypothetical protein [Verrucomicrobiota bacterium]NBT23633.1 hypothetical protein [bacterium]